MNRMYCTKNLKNLLFDIKLIAISTKKSPFPYSESRGNTDTSFCVFCNYRNIFLLSLGFDMLVYYHGHTPYGIVSVPISWPSETSTIHHTVDNGVS